MTTAPANAAVVRDQFTKQARDFVGAQHATDPDLMGQYVRLIAPRPDERIVDLASGPGLVAAALAPSGCRVTLFDLTPRMLEEARRVAPGAPGAVGDACRAPARGGVFDAVIGRLMLHHVPEPARVLAEMARLVRPRRDPADAGGGRVVVNDIVTSEDSAESEVTEVIERLRDPSHTRCLAPGELVRLVLEAGLRIEAIEPWAMTVDHDEWMNRVYPPEEHRVEVRARLEKLVGRDLGGMRVERRGGMLWITRRGILVRAFRVDGDGFGRLCRGSEARPAT